MKIANLLPKMLMLTVVGSGLSQRVENLDWRIKTRKVWEKAPHDAFTGLAAFKDRLYICFREGTAHGSTDGAIRILSSKDGKSWRSVGRFDSPTYDYRDPKLTVSSGGSLMLTAAAANHSRTSLMTLVWLSTDGSKWSEPAMIGDHDYWLWSVTWHNGVAYGVGYDTSLPAKKRKGLRLYKSDNGKQFTAIVPELYNVDEPDETALAFGQDGTAYAIVRREVKGKSTVLGKAKPPYTDWEWVETGSTFLYSPDAITLTGGRIIVAGRTVFENKFRTGLFELDTLRMKLFPFSWAPSAGESGYPGFALFKGKLWMSYYSSHEDNRTAIYIANMSPQ